LKCRGIQYGRSTEDTRRTGKEDLGSSGEIGGNLGKQREILNGRAREDTDGTLRDLGREIPWRPWENYGRYMDLKGETEEKYRKICGR
jgi:hypothetical protein